MIKANSDLFLYSCTLCDGNFYKASNGKVYVIESEMSEMFMIENEAAISCGYTWDEEHVSLNYVNATRNDLRKNGLWQYVANKDEFVHIEDVLDIYLQIGSSTQQPNKTHFHPELAVKGRKMKE